MTANVCGYYTYEIGLKETVYGENDLCFMVKMQQLRNGGKKW